MKLKTFAAEINNLAKKYPDLDVVMVEDEEQGRLIHIDNSPSLGHIEKNRFYYCSGGPFIAVNAVSIN